MPQMFNADHQPAVVDHDARAVLPGDPHDFTDEQAEAGLAGCWSDTDPRAGLDAEKAFKRKRDADPKPTPAESGEKE